MMIRLRFLIINAMLAVVGRLITAQDRALGVVPRRSPMHPIERLLLASLVGAAICGAWIAFAWRAMG